MAKKSYILFFLLCSTSLFAQQLPHFSQYFLNDFLINPAVAGSRNYFEGKSTHRYQWEGIVDAPRTYTLSVNGPTKSRKMGMGGSLFTDITGPTRRTGFNLAYAYHLKLNESLKLSLGVSGGLLQFIIDGSRINLRDEDDAILTRSVQSVTVPDAGFGAYLYHDKFYVGLSVPQLLNSKIKFFDGETNPEGRLLGHYFLTAGYSHEINETFSIDPSLMVKYVPPTPMQIEATLRLIYKKKLWLAGTYRDKDAVTVSLGYIIKDYFTIAYGYDVTTTNLKNYSNGSHEMMVGIRFYRKKTDDS